MTSYKGLIKTEDDLDLFMIVLFQFLFGDDVKEDNIKEEKKINLF